MTWSADSQGLKINSKVSVFNILRAKVFFKYFQLWGWKQSTILLFVILSLFSMKIQMFKKPRLSTLFLTWIFKRDIFQTLWGYSKKTAPLHIKSQRNTFFFFFPLSIWLIDTSRWWSMCPDAKMWQTPWNKARDDEEFHPMLGGSWTIWWAAAVGGGVPPCAKKVGFGSLVHPLHWLQRSESLNEKVDLAPLWL